MPHRSLFGQRILVVKDVLSIRNLIVKLLERLGCEAIYEASDTETAWQHLKHQPLNAMLLDFDLPTDNGVALAWRVRADDTLRNQNVPIILLTAHDSATVVEMARKADVDAYLVKPVMPDVLGLRIVEAIRKRLGDDALPPRGTEVSWRR